MTSAADTQPPPELPGHVHEQELAPGVLQWTLQNPSKRNALTPVMLDWLSQRAGSLRGEVVLLRGAGSAFCAGFDLDALPGDPSPNDLPYAPDTPLIVAATALRRANATLVALLHGPVYGAGVELACCCDLRLASDDTRFVIPAARLGVVYHPDGLALLTHCLGLALTQRLVLLGETVSADEALRAGCLLGVYPADKLAAAGHEVAERLRAGAPLSLRAHRDLLRVLASGHPPPAAELTAYQRARQDAYLSDDHREGRAAARERRSPRFSGR